MHGESVLDEDRSMHMFRRCSRAVSGDGKGVFKGQLGSFDKNRCV